MLLDSDPGSNKSRELAKAQRKRHLDPDDGLQKQPHVFTPNNDHLLLMLRENNLNWFSFVEELKLLLRNYDNEVINHVLLYFSQNLDAMDLDDKEQESVEMSSRLT